MLPGSHQGEWHLPNGIKLAGRIVIDKEKKNIQLETYGTVYLEGSDIKKLNYPEQFHKIILGNCDAPVTLCNCKYAGATELGKDLFQVLYNVEYVFTDIHFPDNNVNIRAATFVFPHLSNWFDGEDFLYKLDGKGGLFVEGKEIIQDMLTRDEIEIKPGFKVRMWDEVNTRIEEMSISKRKVYSKYTRFEYETSVPFSQLIADAATFLKLLEFCLGKPLGYSIIYAYSDHAEKPRQPLHVNTYSRERGKKIEHYSIHGRHMLMSRWTSTAAEMKALIVKWFNNQRYFNIYEYYLDSNNWFKGSDAVLSNVMFNNRFLNLVQGLEDYYREDLNIERGSAERSVFDTRKAEITKTIKDKDLKKWFNDAFKFARHSKMNEKLETILEALKDDLSELMSGISLQEFPRSATDFRNDLSHGKNKEINLGKALHRDYFIAQVLLGTCILKTLDINNIKDKIAYYQKFQDAAAEIEHLNQQLKPVSSL